MNRILFHGMMIIALLGFAGNRTAWAQDPPPGDTGTTDTTDVAPLPHSDNFLPMQAGDLGAPLAGDPPATDPPGTVPIQGTLTDATGHPLTGTRVWQVQYYDAATGGNPLGAALTGTLTVSPTGRWSISLIPPAEVLTATSAAIYYELAIDSAPTPDDVIDPSDVFAKRIKVESVIFAQIAANARVRLTAPATFHVSPSGNDTTGDGSSANPWATRSHAYAVLTQYDLNGQSVTIQMDAGTYTDSLVATGILRGQGGGVGQVTFMGNTSNPASVVITPSSGPAFKAVYGAQFSVRGVKMDMSVAQADTIYIGQNSTINISFLIFGANVNPYNDINVQMMGGLGVDDDYVIDGTNDSKSTTATFGSGSTTIAVADASGVVVNMGIAGAGIAPGSYVSAINGTNLTLSQATTSAQTNTPVTISYGGRSHLNMGLGAQSYYNTNGDPAYAIRVDILGKPFYSAGFVCLSDISSVNIQAITFTGQFSGPAFLVQGNSSLDTQYQGVPYFPNDVYAATTANTTANSSSMTVASATGISVGMAVNGYAAPTATFASGAKAITVSSNSFILAGNQVKGPGIVAGTTVSSVAGTTINLSYPTYAAGSGVTLWFTQYSNTGVRAGTTVTGVSGNTITLSQPTLTTTTGQPVWFSGLVQSGGQYM